MFYRRSWRRPARMLLPAVVLLAAAVLVAPSLMPAPAALAESTAGATTTRQNYIVTLNVSNAGRPIRPTGRANRQRLLRRASQTAAATDRLSRKLGFRVRQRYSSALAGFSARLTPAQAASLRRDGSVLTVRPARRFHVAGQVVPRSLQRIRGAPGGAAMPDTDADIAIIDTGIGPVGGGELNVQGGINCSGDGLASDVWQDLYSGKHGTHVAGTAAARDNGVGIVGVAPGARLWSVRVFRASGFGDESTVVCGLDWVVSTHGPSAPAGSQPIDVVNMSIQGPRRPNAPEDCVADDPDPVHVAVCAAYAAGITIVAAAGNDGTNAANVTPAGYDQVITVGAISDFDGQPGGKASSDCLFFESERDDRYARYSNYGPDVDIVAPGTCVLSTYPSASGDQTRRMTGTSMAAPSVTGAVARYLADHPGTSPTRMRRLVRAAGRPDWFLTSDPDWRGPNDLEAPKRLLDVQTLLGGPSLRTWIFPTAFKVGGTDTTRDIRVDVQRGGGYSDDVQLSLAGLPGAVGSGTFDRPGATLSGLAELGARLVLNLKRSSPDGPQDLVVGASGAGGTPADSSNLRLVIDRTGPVSVLRTARFVRGGARVSKTGRAAILLAWKTHDELSNVQKSLLERRVGRRPWTRISDASKKANRSEMSIVSAGTLYRFRVRASDTKGNTSKTAAMRLRMEVIDSTSSRWQLAAGGWRRTTNRKALGGSLLVARSAAPSSKLEFAGTALAIVAPVGPHRGVLRVRVDGAAWHRVDLRSASPATRRVVFGRRFAAGTHHLEVRAVRGPAAVDAVLVVG